MKALTTIQINILNALADGQCHSGHLLGINLGVTRTAIWKQITQLIKLGFPIARIPQQGYRLEKPLQFLNKQEIVNYLTANQFVKEIELNLFTSVDSTNRAVKELRRSEGITVCCAETQTHGRGRFGRTWFSPFGENIYCSTRRLFHCDFSRLAGLSLVVSMAVLSTLKQFNLEQNIQIKWPNDILWKDKKLCGILIEISAESNGCSDVIIGMGLNVNSSVKDSDALGNTYHSLRDITGKIFDRNQLIAAFIIQLDQAIQQFLEHGLQAFMENWKQVDYLYEKHTTVSHISGLISGIAKGINAAGQLILVDDKNNYHLLSSGDTSLNAGK